MFGLGTGLKVVARKARIGKKTIHYEVCGSREPLILLHELSGSTRWWTKNIKYFARRYQVVLVDLVGFGRGRGQPFVLKEAANLIAIWLQALDLGPVRLAGHSMGGYIAIDLAARFPELVDRLVLVDALALPIGRNILLNTLGLAEAVWFMPFDFYPVLLTDALRAGPVTLIKAIREILAVDISHNLGQIQAPALIVWGKNDTVLPLQLGLDLHQELPGSTLEVISGAGHNPMWDRPHKFNEIVSLFLQTPR